MKRSFHHCTIMIILFLSVSMSLSPDIKNAFVPLCINCIHHKAKLNSYGQDKCMRFGVRDVVREVLSYEDAKDCRQDEKKCGIDGIYFEKVPNPQLKMIEDAPIDKWESRLKSPYGYCC